MQVRGPAGAKGKEVKCLVNGGERPMRASAATEDSHRRAARKSLGDTPACLRMPL